MITPSSTTTAESTSSSDCPAPGWMQPRAVTMAERLRHVSPALLNSITSFGSDASVKRAAPPMVREDFVLAIPSQQFEEIMRRSKDGIKSGALPERISKGSSGSYFVKSRYGHTMGVFKPKDEEPYSNMNPKWSKWLHRSCFPCCFGRSCVMVGTGYLSETAASVVDRFLGLDLVPRTEIQALGAASFYYSIGDWWQARKRAQAETADGSLYTFYREKIGSFQIFVEDFRDAEAVLKEFDENKLLGKELKDVFYGEFEKLVILDYAIRNTDRGLDNLLVRVDWVEDLEAQDVVVEGVPQHYSSIKPVVKAAAIDNGLAFPYKHPDNWRTYPFGWAKLEYVQRPFSPRFASRVLAVLADRDNWDELVEQLRLVFKQDEQFRERHFQRQMSVLRGQLRNIVDVLQAGGTPQDLLNMEPLLIQEQEEYFHDVRKATQAFPPKKPLRGAFDGDDSTEGHPRWKRVANAHPFCSSC